jgi:hypothetical protein
MQLSQILDLQSSIIIMVSNNSNFKVLQLLVSLLLTCLMPFLTFLFHRSEWIGEWNAKLTGSATGAAVSSSAP